MSEQSLNNSPIKAKRTLKRLTIRGYTEKAKSNLRRQQKAYRVLTGKNIALDVLAAKLLETATIQQPTI